MTPDLELPAALVEAVEQEGDGRRTAWLAALPDVVDDLARRWQLRVGRPFQPGGTGSWTAPATGPDGADLALKVVWPHFEAEHEADGLRVWDGDGVVRLVADRQDDDVTALLVERCRPGTELAERPPREQDEVLAGLLRRLWVEPPVDHGFRPLSTMCDRWVDELIDADAAGERAEAEGGRELDPGLARTGRDLFRSLPRDATPQVLLATDLHAHNVLQAEREPWLVIDPKPWLGDPAYDPVQHLLNHPERLVADADGLVDRMAHLTDVDPSRLRQWTFARCVVETRSFPGWTAEVARQLAP